MLTEYMQGKINDMTEEEKLELIAITLGSIQLSSKNTVDKVDTIRMLVLTKIAELMRQGWRSAKLHSTATDETWNADNAPALEFKNGAKVYLLAGNRWRVESIATSYSHEIAVEKTTTYPTVCSILKDLLDGKPYWYFSEEACKEASEVIQQWYSETAKYYNSSCREYLAHLL